MELVVDIAEANGRLTGIVRRATSTDTHPFTGSLELLACLERLCDPGRRDRRERCSGSCSRSTAGPSWS
jgi:hypothetical protein